MWKYFDCCKKQLNLDLVLSCGQSFRWKKKADSDVWIGVLNNKLFLLKQDNDKVYYQVKCKDNVKPKSSVRDDEEAFLKEYFQLDTDVIKLYKYWNKVDPNTKIYNSNFYGIRILQQDPVENLFSFICSQCNNIIRISQLVEKLCKTYGEFIVSFENEEYYSFPKIEHLSGQNVEKELRNMGFGYRAKFINQTAKTICQKYDGVSWLFDLKKRTYEEAFNGLISLPGVGAKVADCVCLMSLNKPQAVPVDTHIWQIAVREYLPHLKKNKTLTDKTYIEVGNFFRKLYGNYAGWAQSVLFSADLTRFKELKEDRKEGEPGNKRKKSRQGKTTVKKSKSNGGIGQN